jgi:hypothetical protein
MLVLPRPQRSGLGEHNMRTIDDLINQLKADNYRIEERATREIDRLRQHCLAFFDHQQQQTDSFVTAVSISLDQLMVNIKEGFPDKLAYEEGDEPFPAVVTGRHLTEEEQAKIMANLAATVSQGQQ